ncbi:MAG: AraC family transcriptional regulator [Bacteroidota bacterium]
MAILQKDHSNIGNESEYHQLPMLDGLELLYAKSHTLDFPFHTHDTFNIALILNSTFNTKLTDKFLKAPTGTLSITNPHEVHATPCDHDLGNSFFTYYVSPEAIQSFNKGESVFFEDKIIYDPDLFQELYYLSSHYGEDNLLFEKRLCCALTTLVIRYGSVPATSHADSRLFQTFLQEANFERFSVDKTAHQFGMSKFKFIRLFKQETGLTPNHYVLLRKIEASKRMLKAGKPIFDAAIDCGFYDTSHFYKNFKRFTGVNPMEFQGAFLA